jgi:hypothetical protein
MPSGQIEVQAVCSFRSKYELFKVWSISTTSPPKVLRSRFGDFIQLLYGTKVRRIVISAMGRSSDGGRH